MQNGGHVGFQIRFQIGFQIGGQLGGQVGSAWGTRGVAYAVGFGAFFVGYLISSLAGFVEWLGQVKYLSFFYYYNGYYTAADLNSLIDGILLTPWLVMGSSIVIFLVLAILMLPRRDIH